MAKVEAKERAATKAPGRPLVSVVVPTYNRAGYLRETIDSILGQDYPDIECIVVDANSNDGTLELLESYGDRIRWISEPDNGAFDAINKGWRMSHGTILAWLNADDRWEPGAVAAAVEHFTRHPGVDVLYGDCGGIDPAGRMLQVFPARDWDFPAALVVCDHIINQASSFMSRRIIERVGGLYPAWCHDHDLWLRIAAAGGVFEAVHVMFASARMQDGNLGNNPAVVIPAKVGLTRRFFDLPDLPGDWRRLRRRAISNAYVRGFDYIRPTVSGHWGWGWHCLTNAITTDPANTPHIIAEIGGRIAQNAPVTGAAARAGMGAGRLLGRMAARVAKPALVALLAGIWWELHQMNGRKR
ncbi:MAG: glycosyltransferase [Chloroflexi bacterium]|nr:glycosyltransferase [Chloroflexota bacterium]